MAKKNNIQKRAEQIVKPLTEAEFTALIIQASAASKTSTGAK